MGINWKVRLKNPYFWIGIIGVILSAMGISADTLTSWSAVGQSLLELVKNPYMIVSVIMAVLGTLTDPTTAGISDSDLALTYDSPKPKTVETVDESDVEADTNDEE